MNNIDIYTQQSELSIYEFIALNLIYREEYTSVKAFYNRHSNYINFSKLEDLGYIKMLTTHLDLEDLELRSKTKTMFKINIDNPKVRAELLVEPFRAIFPTGVNASGYRYRGDKQGVEDKLIKFIKKYSKYDDTQILLAAKQYVNRFKPDYIGMRQAHYFIEKEKTSDLLGELENLSSTIEEVNTDINTMI